MKSLQITTGLLAAMGLSGVALAGSITINPGTGAFQVSAFDWTPGNLLAVGGNQANSNYQFTQLFQASLATFNGDNGNPLANQAGLNSDYEITLVSKFVMNAVATPTDINFDTIPDMATASFNGPVAGEINFFEIYYDSNVNADPLSGLGYNDGDLILSGAIFAATGGFQSYFQTPGTGVNFNPAGPNGVGANGYNLLDQFGSNNWGGQQTVDGIGGSKLSADAITQNQDRNFFLSNVINLTIDVNLTTQNNLPFDTTNPARQMFDGTVTATNLGTVNGLNPLTAGSLNLTAGTDILLLSDASSTFNSVPEPTTLLLMGAGLVGLGIGARKKIATC